MAKNSSRRKKRSRSGSRRTATTKNVRNALIVGIGGAITAFLVWGAGLVGDLAGSADPVLYVTAELAPPFAVCEGGTGWVFQRETKALPTAPPLPRLDKWAAEGGGVPASGNYVDVQLQGAGSRTVIVTDIRFEVTRRRRPPEGAHTVTPGGCGGIVPSFFSADLDHPSPIPARPIAGESVEGKRVPPVPLPHAISRTRPEVWHIQATTRRCDCEWVAYIDWVSDGEHGTAKVTDDGAPFRTAASSRTLEVELSSGEKWEPVAAPSLGGGERRLIVYGEATEFRGSSAYEEGEVTLLAQRFPFEEPYRPVGTDPVGSLSPFTFTQRPTVATRYKAALSTDLRAASRPMTVFVTPLMKINSETAEVRFKGSDEVRYRQVGTVAARLPRRLSSLPQAREAFIYFGAKKGQEQPPRLRLADRVQLRRSGDRLWSTHFSFLATNLPAQPRTTQTFFCVPPPYEVTGLGLPRPDSPCGKRGWIKAPRSPKGND